MFLTANVFNHNRFSDKNNNPFVDFSRLNRHYSGDTHTIAIIVHICEPLQSFLIFFNS